MPVGAAGHAAHGARRERDPEQFIQSLRGAAAGQELPAIQIDQYRREPRPVLHCRLPDRTYDVPNVVSAEFSRTRE